eukprot:742242-Hanusia_phi.AAC.1
MGRNFVCKEREVIGASSLTCSSGLRSSASLCKQRRSSTFSSMALHSLPSASHPPRSFPVSSSSLALGLFLTSPLTGSILLQWTELGQCQTATGSV